MAQAQVLDYLFAVQGLILLCSGAIGVLPSNQYIPTPARLKDTSNVVVHAFRYSPLSPQALLALTVATA